MPILSLLSDYCSSEMIQPEDLCIERGKVTLFHPQSQNILEGDCCKRSVISPVPAVLGALL